MKLQHKIAGTILLPLAAAAMVSTAQAADVTIGGSVRVHAMESTPKSKDMDFSADVSDSRFTVKVKDERGVTAVYETFMTGALRHAYITFDGITAGQTWKPSAALELLFPTVDATGNALTSAPARRVGQISTKLDLGAGSLNVGIYSDNNQSTAVPGIAAKFVGDMGGFKLIAAVDMQQKDGTKNTGAPYNAKSVSQMTLGAVADLSGMTVQAVFSNVSGGNFNAVNGGVGASTTADETIMGASVSVPMGDGLKFNAAFETADKGKTDAMWVNVMTKTASGVNLGLEYRNDHSETSVIDALIKYDF